MKLHQIITEVPLPADWDENVFSDKVSFDKQLEYALERTRDFGSGSGRMAFEIQYQGRPTILKIAKNQKGLQQNVSEARPEIYRKFRGVVIPLIDFDTKNKLPRWVHFEKAEPIRTENEWSSRFGMSIYAFAELIEYLIKGGQLTEDFKQKYISQIKLATKMVELSKQFDIDINDLSTIQNWGIYKGEVVLLDLGMDSASAKLYNLDLYR